MRFACLVAAWAGVGAYTLGAWRAPATHGGRAAVAIMQQMPGEMKIISEETYGLMLSTLFKTENPIAQEISANYAMVDYGFLTRLDQIIADGGENAVKANEIKEAVNAEMATRMQAAAEVMKDIFASPTPVIMEGKVAGLARQGRIDDALLQLLEANLQQAQAAGEQGKGAVAVLSKLQKRVQDELDKKLDPQQTLLRQLLRMESPEARQRLLKEKMSPRATSNIVIAGVGGAEDKKDDDGSPEVPPKQMAEAIKALKQRFGNVDEQYDTGFVKKLETIGDEAEAVALELAGGRVRATHAVVAAAKGGRGGPPHGPPRAARCTRRAAGLHSPPSPPPRSAGDDGAAAAGHDVESRHGVRVGPGSDRGAGRAGGQDGRVGAGGAGPDGAAGHGVARGRHQEGPARWRVSDVAPYGAGGRGGGAGAGGAGRGGAGRGGGGGGGG